MAGILRGLFTFHKWLNPEDLATFEEFGASARYSGYTAGGTIGAGLGQSAAQGRRIKFKTGLADWVANRFSHGLTTSLPVRSTAVMAKRPNPYSGSGGRPRKRPSYRKKKNRKGRKGKKTYRKKGTTASGVIQRYTPVIEQRVTWASKNVRSNARRAARAFKLLNVAAGATATHVETASFTIGPTVAGACATEGLFLFTGYGAASAKNGADLPSLMAIALNKAPASSLTDLRAVKQHMWVESAHIKFSLGETETGNVDTHYDIYECICIRSCGADVGAGLANMITNFLARESAPGTHGGAALTATHIAVSPYLLHEFGKYFKVYKVQSGQINGTDTLNFRRHFNINKLLNPDQFLDGNHYYFKGISRLFFVKAYGSLGLTNAQQSCSLNVNYNITYKFTMQSVTTPYVTTTIPAAVS